MATVDEPYNIDAIYDMAVDIIGKSIANINDSSGMTGKIGDIYVNPNSNIKHVVNNMFGSTKRNSKKSVPTNTKPKKNANTPIKLLKTFSNLLTVKSFGKPDTKDVEENKTTSKKKPLCAISGSYKNDYNILRVHNIIMDKFDNDQKIVIQDLQNQRAKEEVKMSIPQTVISMKTIQRRIDAIDNKIKSIENHSDVVNYLNKTSGLLEMYTELGPIPEVVSFEHNIKTDVDIDEDEQKVRHIIISSYLECARLYIDIDIMQEIDPKYTCEGCGSDMTDAIVADSGIPQCANCGIERMELDKFNYYRDVNKTNTLHKNNYEDRNNFWKSLQRYQGKQDNRLPDNLMSVLDNYFNNYGMQLSADIRSMPKKENGRRGDTSKQLMYTALHGTNNSIYYDDVNLICNQYWGWDLPDVTHLEDEIMERYDRSQIVFNEIKGDRNSSLNVQYRLYWHLTDVNHKCRLDDFKIISTPEILQYYEDKRKRICKELGWNYKGII